MQDQQITSLLEYQYFYLVGIKGVAMTSLAQCLVDAGKQVSGSDVKEDFVTKKQLERIQVKIDYSFEPQLIENADCVIYTAAHQGPGNPQVTAAQEKGIPTFSHAQALGLLFNQKKGVAVCGVGGKSTTSAMISWILSKVSSDKNDQPSFAVGVGNIAGLDKTGNWNNKSQYFIAEADEYVTDPHAVSKGQEITPRFSFLHPWLTVCTNLTFDHPDVYRDFDHTKQVYATFFEQIKKDGVLVINADDAELVTLAANWSAKTNSSTTGGTVVTFGKTKGATIQLLTYSAAAGSTTTTFLYQGKEHTLVLKIPGIFNVMNALAAITVCLQLNIPLEDSTSALAHFSSTMRRSEFIGEKNGVLYYDDYAHHPLEVKNIIKAFQEWFTDKRLVIAFQSHTFSRTKQLFNDFVDALGTANEVVMIDIFASARESFDPTVSSDTLCKAIQEKYPDTLVKNLGSIQNMATFFSTELQPGDVVLTVGAGDIYQVHELLSDN